MRLKASILALFTLVGCSSAGDLPLGGPYGGTSTAPTSDADGGFIEPQNQGGDNGSGSGSSVGTTGNTGGGNTGGGNTGSGNTGSGNTGGGNTGGGNTGSGNTGSGTGGGNTGSGTGGGNTGSGTGGGNTGSGTGGGNTGSGSGTSSGAPTWTDLYTKYLAVGTIGNCDGSCHHHSQCSSASSCYSWIGTGNHGAVANGGGLFSWDSGYMPTNGPTSEPQAESDFAAWVAAGSLDN